MWLAFVTQDLSLSVRESQECKQKTRFTKLNAIHRIKLSKGNKNPKMFEREKGRVSTLCPNFLLRTDSFDHTLQIPSGLP